MTSTKWTNIGIVTLIIAVVTGAVYLGQLEGRIKGLSPEEIKKAEESAVERISQLARPPSLVKKDEEYKWKRGEEEVKMIALEEGFCSLVRITGKFEGGGEEVYIDIKGDYWYLGGKSAYKSVAAGARCWKWSK